MRRSAWPQIRRCMLAQWRGYDWFERSQMGVNHDGSVTFVVLGQSEYPIWYRQRLSSNGSPVCRSAGETWMMVKIERIPEDLAGEAKP